MLQRSLARWAKDLASSPDKRDFIGEPREVEGQLLAEMARIRAITDNPLWVELNSLIYEENYDEDRRIENLITYLCTSVLDRKGYYIQALD